MEPTPSPCPTWSPAPPGPNRGYALRSTEVTPNPADAADKTTTTLSPAAPSGVFRLLPFQGQTCVDTPILDTLRSSVTNHEMACRATP